MVAETSELKARTKASLQRCRGQNDAPAIWVPRREFHMGIVRTFRDINGIEWRGTHASSEPTAPVAPDGWLSFQTDLLERHLTPVPTNWQTATVQRLEQMCRVARAVQRTETIIESERSVSSGETVPEGTVDTTPAAGSDAVVDSRDHMSLLANAWPAPEARITFRG